MSRKQASVALLALILLLPAVFASHLVEPERDSIFEISAPEELPQRYIETGEPYPYTGLYAVLPTALQEQISTNYGRVTRSPYYYAPSYYYYNKDGVRYLPRLIEAGREIDAEPPVLRDPYWGIAPAALERVYSRRDYSDYYDPRSGADVYGYYQRRITKTEAQYNESMIRGKDLYQRRLEDSDRAKSLGLPDYVDITEVPWYVPPESVKRRAEQFTESRPLPFRGDERGMSRFLPGVFQPRTYFDVEEYTYAPIRAQRILRQPEIEAQRIVGTSDYSRAQRTLSEEYGAKYGYEIRRPPLSFLYSIETPRTGIGSVHDSSLYPYIRLQDQVLPKNTNYAVDPRLQQDVLDTEAYRGFFYQQFSDLVEGEEIEDPNLVFDPERYLVELPETRSAYYRERLAFIDAQYNRMHRRASGLPRLYEPRKDLFKFADDYQSPDAQRILKYETESPLTPPAQRILGTPTGTAQRRLTESTDADVYR